MYLYLSSSKIGWFSNQVVIWEASELRGVCFGLGLTLNANPGLSCTLVALTTKSKEFDDLFEDDDLPF